MSLAVLAFACAPRPHGSDAATAKNPKAPREQRERSDQRDRAADNSGSTHNTTPRIESALAVNVRNTGDGVRFEFRVTNAGGAKVEMNFPSGQTHEVVVLDTLGREVWRWSKGRMFTQMLQNKVLRTDDTLAFGERWPGARRGQYVAVARLASTNYPIEQRTSFVVP